ncbi:MAG: ABC transporter permease subunit [Methylocystaceae bacterium]|nr:ABC transporter permease subunit [Methylocystaceae bacterium]
MPGASPWTQRLLSVYGALVLIFLMLPTVIVIPMSFSDSQYLEFPPTSWSMRWYRVITVLSSLNDYDMTQEMAARSMGSSRPRAFFEITLPQIKFSVMTGAFLAFITSLDEVVVAKFISGGENATITRRMFNALRDQIDPTIAAISTCLIIISVLALASVQIFGTQTKGGT